MHWNKGIFSLLSWVSWITSILMTASTMQSPTTMMTQLKSLKLSNQAIHHGNLKGNLLQTQVFQVCSVLFSLPQARCSPAEESDEKNSITVWGSSSSSSSCFSSSSPYHWQQSGQWQQQEYDSTPHTGHGPLLFWSKTEVYSKLSLSFVTLSPPRYYFHFGRCVCVIRCCGEKHGAGQPGEVRLRVCTRHHRGRQTTTDFLFHLPILCVVCLPTDYPDFCTGMQTLTIAVMKNWSAPSSLAHNVWSQSKTKNPIIF